MKFKILCLLLLALNMQNVQAQKDTVYYLLDTAALPIKDRMFQIENEGPARMYLLKCKCYPSSTSIPFYFDISRKRERIINKQEFRQLKTSSLTELIDFAIRSLDPKAATYQFIFIEPVGEVMKLIDISLAPPYKSTKVESAKLVSTL
jgi:hypothetical protein